MQHGMFIGLEAYARHGIVYNSQAERQCTQLCSFFIDTLGLETGISSYFLRSWDHPCMYLGIVPIIDTQIVLILYFNICNSSFGTRNFFIFQVRVLNYPSVLNTGTWLPPVAGENNCSDEPSSKNMRTCNAHCFDLQPDRTVHVTLHRFFDSDQKWIQKFFTYRI